MANNPVRFEFQNSWVRVLIEFLPREVPMHRYRVARADVMQVRGRMIRRICRRLRHATDSS